MVAALLTDARGRILLARRTHERDLAGLWEFPGGKVEAGESPEAALARELREELGIELGASAPLIAVPHAYAHKRILLDVRRAAGYRGRPHGREAQALAWVAPEKLGAYPMPAADRPVVAALLQPDRYFITPEPGNDDEAFLAHVEAVLAAGVRRVQLRARHADAARLRRLAEGVSRLAQAHGAQWFANSHVDGERLARDFGGGLHLTAAHLRAATQRPDGVALAASCHDADELRLAEALGCDFAVLGPVRPTASHPGAEALGWERFAALRETVALPVYALGGLRADDVPEARAHGAQGIAAIRAFPPTAE